MSDDEATPADPPPVNGDSQPLGLPRGSVRAIQALLLLGTITLLGLFMAVWMTVHENYDGAFQVLAVLVGLDGPAIGLYFGARPGNVNGS